MDEIEMFAALRPAPPATEATEAMRATMLERLAGTVTRQAPAPRHSGPRKRFLMIGGLAAATAAATAIVVPAVLPGGAGGVLAAKAWAVEHGAGGTVTLTLTINQAFGDLRGLQAALRADGVPAIVSLIPWHVTRSHGETLAIQACGYGSLDREPRAVERAVVTHPMSRGAASLFVWIIHPSVMPPGSVLFIEGSAAALNTAGTDTISGPMVLRSAHLPPCVPGQGQQLKWKSGKATRRAAVVELDRGPA